jgi:predicted transcriptional regulator
LRIALPLRTSDFDLYRFASCPLDGIKTEVRRSARPPVALGQFGLPAGGGCHRILLDRALQSGVLMTIKQKACEVISRMPEESTFADIQYHLYVLECIERGERDIEDGKTLTHDEVENRLAKWLR